MSPIPPPASLARRALPALVLTGAAGALLLALDRPLALAGASGRPVVAGGSTTTAAPPPGPGGQPGQPGRPGGFPGGGDDDHGPVGGDNGQGAVATTVPPAPGVTAAGCTGPKLTGPTVQTRYGPVQVAGQLSTSGQLCAVDAPVTPNDRNRSIRINQIAVPMLNEQALATKNANIDGVSGATATTEGYRASLQAMLDAKA